jgi:hypothetical protein
MATEHAAIADPEIHEPKGVAAASSGQVYVANGAGSGSWSAVLTETQHASISNANLHEPKDVSTASAEQVYVADGIGSGTWTTREVILNTIIDDISTASSAWVVCPVAGNITKVQSVIDTAITTADATLTTKIGGVNVTGGGLTVSFTGAAAGDVDSTSPTALNAVSANQAIEIATDGGSTTASKAVITFTIERT